MAHRKTLRVVLKSHNWDPPWLFRAYANGKEVAKVVKYNSGCWQVKEPDHLLNDTLYVRQKDLCEELAAAIFIHQL